MNLRLNWKLCTILLILPCSFLIAFTHYPAVQALLNSFWNNASSRRPSKFIGLKNYEALIQDDKLIQVLLNSTFYAIGTIPIAIILAIVLGVAVSIFRKIISDLRKKPQAKEEVKFPVK